MRYTKNIRFFPYRLALVLILVLQLVGCAASKNLNDAAKINVQLGLAYLDKNQMALAKKHFLQAKNEAPDESMVWSGMGYFLERTGDLAQAELHYQRAIELGSVKGPALNNYGAFLCRQKRYTEALSTFEKAATDPNYLQPALAYVNARACSLKIPNKHLANIYLQKAFAKDPGGTNERG